MSHLCRLILLFCSLAVGQVFGAFDDGLDGLIVNQTMTRFGQDFYSQFVKHWNEYQMVVPANLVVHERPSARWGSQIWIEYRQRMIEYHRIGASTRAIGEIAQRAATNIFNLLLQERSSTVGNGGELEQDDHIY